MRLDKVSFSQTSLRIFFAFRDIFMLLAYSKFFAPTGNIIVCIGDNHKGKAPAKCSIKIPTNLSSDP